MRYFIILTIFGSRISDIGVSVIPKILEYEAAKIAYDKIRTTMILTADLGLWDLYAGTGKSGHNFVLVWKIMPKGSKSYPFALINANDGSIVMYDSGIRTSQSENQVEIKEFSIEADDNGFYPGTIKVKIGDKVKINFKFRDDSIYFAGLDVKGPFEDIKYNLKGEQPVTREFTMKDETKITSWWPASGVKKATLTVEVEK